MQARQVGVSESQPLLSSFGAVSASSRMAALKSGACNCVTYLLSRHTSKLSKPAIVIIIINIFVSFFYATITSVVIEGGYLYGNMTNSSLYYYSFIAIVGLFYPVSGFLADVYCGRYRIIFIGLCLMFGACLIIALSAILGTMLEGKTWHLNIHFATPLSVTFALICVVVFIFGFIGYQANVIQFGLDQLLEAPSTSLALFIHWVMWADSLGRLLIQILFAVIMCELKSHIVDAPVKASILGYISLTMVVLCFSVVLSLKYCDFYAEPGRHNPYKVVFKVLNFAKKHEYPLQRSAFTFTGDEEPSRLDFAKESYGGLYTTEQVEDVKTFLQILFVFVALGPIFVLDVPTSEYVPFLFGVHVTGRHSSVVNHSCTTTFILLSSGSLINLISVVILPVYMWIIFSALRRYAPRLFYRLILAVVFYLLSIISMFCIDLAGHFFTKEKGITNFNMCMFIDISHPPLLRLHWAVLLLPWVLIGIGKPLVMATSFELISAQSPSSMKGLLVGIFLSIRAFFQLFSGIALVPFSSKPLWNSPYMREHPPITNCGFGYLLFTCVVALIGLVLLSVVARRYKYRERDDRPFDHRFADYVYSRDIEERDLENTVCHY